MKLVILVIVVKMVAKWVCNPTLEYFISSIDQGFLTIR